MAQENARHNFTVYDYSAYDTTKVPLEGELRFFDTIETWIKNVCHVIGDGSSKVEELPFVEIMRIETAANISLEDYRITGNRVEIHNTHTSIITFDIGTTGTPNTINLNPDEMVNYKFDGSNWIKLIDSETIEISSDITIDGADPYKKYIISGIVTVTLDALLDSKYKEYEFLLEDDGYVNIVPDGTEKINGLDEIFLFAEGQRVRIIYTSSEWKILYHNIGLKSGKISRSSWQNKHPGFMEVDYDNLSGSFTVGEYVEEEISGNTGKIIKDTGSTLTLVYVTGGGIFTDNRELTGQTSGETCDVDEPGTGSTKDLDSNIYHGMGLNLIDINVSFYLSTDGAYNNDIDLLGMQFSNNIAAETRGYAPMQIDTDTIKIQTGATDVGYMRDNGSAIGAGDDYYEIVLNFKI